MNVEDYFEHMFPELVQHQLLVKISGNVSLDQILPKVM